MTHNKIWLTWNDNAHYTVYVTPPPDGSDVVEYELSQDEQRAASGVYG